MAPLRKLHFRSRHGCATIALKKRLTMNAPETIACATAAMDAAMRTRKSTRAFCSDPVSRQQVEEILAIAGSAPSNSNTQPWQVHVLAGAHKHALSAALLEAHSANQLPPFAHFPDALPPACAARQDDFGARYYSALGIDRADLAARARQTGRNFSFFDAPVGLIFTIDVGLKPHSWLDYGLFVQNVMLAATARGLATCPQVSFARYQTVIARELQLPAGYNVVCGMSLGYADENAAVNHLAMPREPMDKLVTLLGFED